MKRTTTQIFLASIVTVCVTFGAHWWLLIPAWGLVIVAAIKDHYDA